MVTTGVGWLMPSSDAAVSWLHSVSAINEQNLRWAAPGSPLVEIKPDGTVMRSRCICLHRFDAGIDLLFSDDYRIHSGPESWIVSVCIFGDDADSRHCKCRRRLPGVVANMTLKYRIGCGAHAGIDAVRLR